MHCLVLISFFFFLIAYQRFCSLPCYSAPQNIFTALWSQLPAWVSWVILCHLQLLPPTIPSHLPDHSAFHRQCECWQTSIGPRCLSFSHPSSCPSIWVGQHLALIFQAALEIPAALFKLCMVKTAQTHTSKQGGAWGQPAQHAARQGQEKLTFAPAT